MIFFFLGFLCFLFCRYSVGDFKNALRSSRWLNEIAMLFLPEFTAIGEVWRGDLAGERKNIDRTWLFEFPRNDNPPDTLLTCCATFSILSVSTIAVLGLRMEGEVGSTVCGLGLNPSRDCTWFNDWEEEWAWELLTTEKVGKVIFVFLRGVVYS